MGVVMGALCFQFFLRCAFFLQGRAGRYHSHPKFKDSGASLDPAGVGYAHILAGIDVSAAGGLRGHSFCLPFIGNHPCGPASG